MFFLNPRILILASLTALAPFAIDTYLPAFEVMENDLATNSNFIQQTLTFYLVPYTIMTIFHGAISDSIGRIKTIKYGMSLFILGSIGLARTMVYSLLYFGSHFSDLLALLPIVGMPTGWKITLAIILYSSQLGPISIGYRSDSPYFALLLPETLMRLLQHGRTVNPMKQTTPALQISLRLRALPL